MLRGACLMCALAERSTAVAGRKVVKGMLGDAELALRLTIDDGKRGVAGTMTESVPGDVTPEFSLEGSGGRNEILRSMLLARRKHKKYLMPPCISAWTHTGHNGRQFADTTGTGRAQEDSQTTTTTTTTAAAAGGREMECAYVFVIEYEYGYMNV